MNKMIYITKSCLVLMLLILIQSCGSQKKVSYLQDIPDGYAQNGEDIYEIRFQPDDLVSIVVSSKSPELAQMFNLTMISNVSSSGTYDTYRIMGYLIDKYGNIDFPQLGTMKIAGMTKTELSKYIKDELISKGLINDPVVTVQFLNFQVSVMGEVARPGTFPINRDRFTIFDAISSAGDLTVYGKRENVKIIRIVDGVKTVSEVDLTSADILDSPFYYLKQNDVVYVEPNKVRAGQREINANRSVGTYASIVSVLLSAASLIVSIVL